MRKVDPADVRAAFASDVTSTLDYFDRVATQLSGIPSEKQDNSHLAADSFVVLYVSFERFLSDLFLAYLNRDFAVYKAQLESNLAKSITERFGAGVAGVITTNVPNHVPMETLEGLVDPKAYNITFTTTHQMKERAKLWLAIPYATRINSTAAHEDRLVETARLIRNFLAHQSPASKKAMNDALLTVTAGTHNAGLSRGARQIDNVGAYLKTFHAGVRRLHRYGQGLGAISGKL